MLLFLLYHIIGIIVLYVILHFCFKNRIKKGSFNKRTLDLSILILSSFALLGSLITVSNNFSEIEEFNEGEECYRDFHNVLMTLNHFDGTWKIYSDNQLIPRSEEHDRILNSLKSYFNESNRETFMSKFHNPKVWFENNRSYKDSIDFLSSAVTSNEILLKMSIELNNEIAEFEDSISKLRVLTEENDLTGFEFIFNFIYSICFSISVSLSLIRITKFE